MSDDYFDYDAFFGDSRSPGTSSINTSLSPKSNAEVESGIAPTYSMNVNFDDTVVDFNKLDILMNDAAVDLDGFSSFFNENNFPAQSDASTFESLFTNFGPAEQQIEELSASSSSDVSPCSPASSTTTSTVPTIINCVQVGPIARIVSTNPASLTVGAAQKLPTIRIIQKSKPLTVTSPSVIQLSPVKSEEPILELKSPETPPAKRRRSDSSTNQCSISSATTLPSTLTLEQLRMQYGHLSDDALRKHFRMIKNRESAALSRKRRKEFMDTLDTQVKALKNENEQLKKENSKLITRVETLTIENELLKKYKNVPNNMSSVSKVAPKPMILLGITLLVVANLFGFSQFSTSTSKSSGEIEYFNGERSMVPSRTILSGNDRRRSESYSISERDDGTLQSPPDGQVSYPFIQCVAYINKTHSKRINQDLRSLVEENVPTKREIVLESRPMTISRSKIDEKLIEEERNDVIPVPPTSRRISLRQQRLSRTNPTGKNQLEAYSKFETSHDDFIESIDRKNDTVYFVSFKRDHLIFPATAQNQTQRPKMSIILPASISNLNKSIHVPSNHIPMIKIDCEVEDTQLVFIKQNHIPLSYRHDLLQYYSSASPTNM